MTCGPLAQISPGWPSGTSMSSTSSSLISVDGKGRPTVPEKEVAVIGRFRESVAFQDVFSGQRFPLLRGRGQDCGAPADGHTQTGEVYFLDAGVHCHRAKQRIDARENGEARLLKSVAEALDIARIGNQPVLGADGEKGDEIHHQ